MIVAAAAAIRRRVRLVVLLDASREAGLDPLPTRRLHLIAYLANVLSPVWDMPSVDGTVLKRRGGPFYPDLQADLDRLVGLGVARVEGLRHQRIDDDRYRLEGRFRLDRELARPICRCDGASCCRSSAPPTGCWISAAVRVTSPPRSLRRGRP